MGFGVGYGSWTRIERVGDDLSHWVPDRYLRPVSCYAKNTNPDYKPAWDQSIIRDLPNDTQNRESVSPRTHALTDPFRNLKGMTKIDNMNPALQQWLLIPGRLAGSAVGSAGGAMNTAINSNCACVK